MELYRYATEQIRRLWYETPQPAKSDTATRQQRIEALFADFRAKGVTNTDAEGGTVWPLERWTMRHPKLTKKGAESELINVITDYLLDVDQVAERSEDYPVYNAETEWRQEGARKENERTLMLDGEAGDMDEEWPAAFDPYSINEDKMAHALDNPVEDELFPKDNASDPDSLIALIDTAKQNPRKYAGGSRGAESEVRVKIRRLDTDRVRVCECCGQAYYAHDLKQKYCDVMRSFKQPAFSHCGYVMNLKNNRKTASY
ncbi:hypothetical protein [Salibacterium halotolerans]|uniref:Uncharacterized protein n=1 Tax=Salibacterium halotolerans TaxID=1884432 RepID=A0A1I5UVS5_9BACI|nr:hypothetical protein [Salibacterium halotolerans]SFP99310.1 hypothetical protein SAMN05518683_11474 [Salibacterium halotolerans]